MEMLLDEIGCEHSCFKSAAPERISAVLRPTAHHKLDRLLCAMLGEEHKSYYFLLRIQITAGMIDNVFSILYIMVLAIYNKL
jgi:hypothetical protein